MWKLTGWVCVCKWNLTARIQREVNGFALPERAWRTPFFCSQAEPIICPTPSMSQQAQVVKVFLRQVARFLQVEESETRGGATAGSDQATLQNFKPNVSLGGPQAIMTTSQGQKERTYWEVSLSSCSFDQLPDMPVGGRTKPPIDQTNMSSKFKLRQGAQWLERKERDKEEDEWLRWMKKKWKKKEKNEVIDGDEDRELNSKKDAEKIVSTWVDPRVAVTTKWRTEHGLCCSWEWPGRLSWEPATGARRCPGHKATSLIPFSPPASRKHKRGTGWKSVSMTRWWDDRSSTNGIDDSCCMRRGIARRRPASPDWSSELILHADLHAKKATRRGSSKKLVRPKLVSTTSWPRTTWVCNSFHDPPHALNCLFSWRCCIASNLLPGSA